MEYKENEENWLTYGTRAAVTYLPIDEVEEGLLMNMENVLKNKKWTLFLDYFVEQLTKNQNIFIVIWNVSKHRHSTISEAEGWNSKLNSAIRMQQPNVFFTGKEIKMGNRVFILAAEVKGTWTTWSKTKKGLCVKRREN